MRHLYETLIRERSYSPYAKSQSSDETSHRAFAGGCCKSHGAEGPGAVRDLGGSAHRPGQSFRRLREKKRSGMANRARDVPVERKNDECLKAINPVIPTNRSVRRPTSKPATRKK